MTERAKITPYEKTDSGLVVTLNPWDIGLLEAIQKEGKGTTIFKSRELPGLPTKLIQLQKPVKWIVSGALVQAQAGDYVASYRRANVPEGAELVARIPEKVVERLTARYRELARAHEDKEIQAIIGMAPTFKIYSRSISQMIMSGNADVLYPKEGQQSFEKPNRITQVFRFKNDVTLMLATGKRKNMPSKSFYAGQTVAVMQDKDGRADVCLVMPEQVEELIGSLRRDDRIARYSYMEKLKRGVQAKVRKNPLLRKKQNER